MLAPIRTCNCGIVTGGFKYSTEITKFKTHLNLGAREVPKYC